MSRDQAARMPDGELLGDVLSRVQTIERRDAYPSVEPDTDWHYIGDPGEPAFTNGWANYAFGNYGAAAYRIDSEGWVRLKGLIRNGTPGAAAFTVPFTTPGGYASQAVVSGITGGFVAVGTGGSVIPVGATSATYIFLDGVRFPVWGLADLRWLRLDIPPYREASTAWARTPRAFLRRNGMIELTGLAGPWSELNPAMVTGGVAPDMAYRYEAFTSKAPGRGVVDLLDGKCDNNISPASTEFIVLGGMEFPTITTEKQFTDLTLLNSWEPFWVATQSSNWAPPRMFYDTDGAVHLHGLAEKPSGAATDVMATLEAGFRPAEDRVFLVHSDSGAARLEVQADGDVYVSSGGSTTLQSLSAVNFLAEQ